MQVYLIRHTATNADKGLCYGQTDLELKTPFLPTFVSIKNKLPKNINRVYSSPLRRCTQLATFLSNQHYEVNDLLKELNFGNWENQYWNDLPQEEMTLWMNDFVHVCPPNGESFEELNTRVKHFIDHTLFKNHDEHESIVIITHAGIIRSFICNLLELDLSKAFKINIDYGAVSLLNLYQNSALSNLVYTNAT
jgi:alpha-ribazole phosphatase